MARLLDTIRDPRDLKALTVPGDLPRLAAEIREEIIGTVAKTGGHLASSLGAVELTIALHYVLDAPRDVILWDVGHQTYAHKILTGRLARFHTLRQEGGLSGFPNKDESPYDPVTCGHASTSISTALGVAAARDIGEGKEKIVAVVGDASLAGGMAFEALNHAGHLKKDIIVVLNDNELSISPPIGALSKYLNRILVNPAYNKIHKDLERVVRRIPVFGFRAARATRRLEEGLKNLLVPGMLFEELGFRYLGPIDGHDLPQLVHTLTRVTGLDGPLLVHVLTKKGKGYRYAETGPGAFHGTGPFRKETGQKAASCPGEGRTFTEAFGEKMTALAAKDPRIVAVTAAMIDGTGLTGFAGAFPGRFFDVGIAEEHAVAFAGGLALKGLRPFVAVYSTFLQRGYDQMLHDVCLQGLPVVFCLDRAGIVGEDGATHQGLFDIAYLRHMPGMTVMAPRDTEELEAMLDFALERRGPSAIRYPKGASPQIPSSRARPPIAEGKAEVLTEGGDCAVVALGSMVGVALAAAGRCSREHGRHATVVNARFAAPLDAGFYRGLAVRFRRIVTVEEGVADGGFGSAVLECLERERVRSAVVTRIGLPARFIEHGARDAMLAKYRLTPEAVCDEMIRET